MFHDRTRLIEDLTGVRSSKLNYYIELKKRNREISIQNSRLQVIHQLSRDINIDMPLETILERVYQNLPSVIPCDFIGVVLSEGDKLRVTAAQPSHLSSLEIVVPKDSSVWEVISKGKGQPYWGPVTGKILACFPAIADLQLQTIILIPLRVKNTAAGTLVMGSRKNRAYTKSEFEFAQQLADHLAVCLQNRQLFEAIVNSKRHWEETFRAITDPLFLIDCEYNVLLDNGRFHQLHERAAINNMKDKKCYQYLWDQETKCAPCILEEMFAFGKSTCHRLERWGKVFEIYCYPVFNLENEVHSGILHIKDITQKVHMEAQLIQSAKLAAIGEMAAGVAHELNSPLTVIIGTAQILLRELSPDHPACNSLKDIVTCGLRCRKIIQDLLAFSRRERPAVAPVNLNVVVERVLNLIMYQLKRHGIYLDTHLDPDLPRVLADGQQLEQVLINLILNARDALDGSEGEKYIRITTGKRTTEQGQRHLYITVEDNGQGISPENLGRIFDPFFTTKEPGRGTGLGLSVSLGIAQSHGGTIEVESRPGRGSVFRLVLPLNAESSD
ncbi:MAG: ATP-binding protein [Moorellaceae bacterium]